MKRLFKWLDKYYCKDSSWTLRYMQRQNRWLLRISPLLRLCFLPILLPVLIELVFAFVSASLLYILTGYNAWHAYGACTFGCYHCRTEGWSRL